MNPLNAMGIVEAWGRGKLAPPVKRPLAILSVALPQATPTELLDLSLGRRDTLLIELRCKTFGRLLESRTRCPCGATLHFELDAEEILAEGRIEGSTTARLLERGDYRIAYRNPSSRDLTAAAACDTVEAGRRVLLDRCVVEAELGGEPVGGAELPDELVAELSERIVEADPLIEVPIDLHCAICGEDTSIVLDIGAFFWEEIAATGERLAYDVYRLARSYGWSEAEILSMGAARRRYYLEMASR